MARYFGTPFADTGDRSAIPDEVQVDGAVSYAQGYGSVYSLDPTDSANTAARRVERQQHNQVLFDVTDSLRLIQETGIAPYDATYNYQVNAVVVGSDGIIYKALAVNGPASTVADPVTPSPAVWEDLFSSVMGSSGGSGNNRWDQTPSSQGSRLRQTFRIGDLADNAVHTISFPTSFGDVPYAVIVSVHGTSATPTSFSFYVDPADYTASNFTLETREFGFDGGAVIAVGPGV